MQGLGASPLPPPLLQLHGSQARKNEVLSASHHGVEAGIPLTGLLFRSSKLISVEKANMTILYDFLIIWYRGLSSVWEQPRHWAVVQVAAIVMVPFVIRCLSFKRQAGPNYRLRGSGERPCQPVAVLLCWV